MKIVHHVRDLQIELARARRAGLTVGLVPTMGALHTGHAALVRRARRSCGFVVVSIFVNPLQFGPKEDLARYPRTLAADARLCRAAGADLVFAPEARAFLAMKSLRTVRAAAPLKKYLCGPFRPGHFDGVTTIVAHFFRIVRPDTAFFGLKDYQQYVVLREMTERLFGRRPRIEPVNTVRERSGLAMSSRNRYLKPGEKRAAPLFYRALDAARRGIRTGKLKTGEAASDFLKKKAGEKGIFKIQYLEVCDARTLKPLRGPLPAGRGKILLAGAVFLGTTRLIDNVLV